MVVRIRGDEMVLVMDIKLEKKKIIMGVSGLNNIYDMCGNIYYESFLWFI